MDLARESSLLDGSTNVKFPPKEAEPTQKSQVPSACKFQAGDHSAGDFDIICYKYYYFFF